MCVAAVGVIIVHNNKHYYIYYVVGGEMALAFTHTRTEPDFSLSSHTLEFIMYPKIIRSHNIPYPTNRAQHKCRSDAREHIYRRRDERMHSFAWCHPSIRKALNRMQSFSPLPTQAKVMRQPRTTTESRINFRQWQRQRQYRMCHITHI